MKFSPKRAAFIVYPHEGGTYSVFTSLREALSPLNIDLRWVGYTLGPSVVRERYAHEVERGDMIDGRDKTATQLGAEIVATIVQGGYGLVFLNVLTSLAEMSAPAYLPPEVRRIMIAHNITLGTHDGARMVRPYVHAGVGVCPRIQDELVGLGYSAAQSFCGPNAIDLRRFENASGAPTGGGAGAAEEQPRVLYLGRMSDVEKGVFWLPGIIRRVRQRGVRATFTMAGDGRDLPELRRLCADLPEVTFLGAVPPAEIPALTARHDLLIMPSRFEGFGYTLIEAMATGCVPVVSAIDGVTDFVVRDGQTGLLFPIGDEAAAAGHLARLAGDAGLRQRLGAAGKADVRARFSIPAMAQAYAPVLEFVKDAPPVRHRFGQPFRLLPVTGLWRGYLPQWVKNVARRHRYR